MIAEKQWQSLGKIDRVLRGILALMMDVDMRLAGISRITALPDYLSLINILTFFHRHTPRHQVGNLQVRPCLFKPDHDPIACRHSHVV